MKDSLKALATKKNFLDEWIANDKFKNVDSYIWWILMFCYIVLTISNDIVANREMTQTVLWLFIVLRILCDLFMIL